jgi:hypothetical protein
VGAVLMVQKAFPPRKCPVTAVEVAVEFYSEIHGIDVGPEATYRRVRFPGASFVADTFEGP